MAADAFVGSGNGFLKVFLEFDLLSFSSIFYFSGTFFQFFDYFPDFGV